MAATGRSGAEPLDAGVRPVTASLRKSTILFNGLFIGLIYFAGAPPTGLIFLTFAVVAITRPKCGTPFIRVGTRNES
jgi:hypothetical protein